MPALLSSVNLTATVVAPDERLPALFQTSRLPDCPVTATINSSGSLWQQELRVNGFILGLQAINLSSGNNLILSCAVESAVLLFVLRGSLTLDAETGTSSTIEERQYCLITCQADSRIRISLPEEFTHLFQLAFSLRMLHKLAGGTTPMEVNQKNETTGSTIIFPYILPVTAPLQELFIKLTSLGLETGMSSIIRLNEICLSLLKKFISDKALYDMHQRWTEKKLLSITELTPFLQDHLDVGSRKQVTLSACANRTRLDIGSFKRLFKSHYGMTLSKYIYRQRMQRAVALITKSGLLPGAIYGEVGYHNFSSFSRAFSNYFGHPPSAVTAENT